MDMTYEERIAGLFERHRSVQSDGFSASAYKPGLERMEELDALSGHPHRRFRSVHVAGTNGKGGVCCMLAAALASCGFRTGLYTSPHLTDFRERIKCSLPGGGAFGMIPKEAVLAFLDRFELPGLSFFELTTGLAFKWFADSQLDFAVLETGLGGRLDSTNIVTPAISIITSIGLDHCDLLGSTRAAIAREKAGIFKPGVPALVWGRDPETQPVFESVAPAVGCPLYYAEDYEIPPLLADAESSRAKPEYMNLRTVWAALSLLTEGGCAFALSSEVQDAILNAYAITGFRARWERLVLSVDALPTCTQKPEIICDIGHNPPALKLCFDRLKASGKRLYIVFGIMADKDLEGILPLMPGEAQWFAVAPSTPRALPAEALAERLSEAGLRVRCCASVREGIAAALGAITHGTAFESPHTDAPALLYIGGSTYTVSDALGSGFFEAVE